MFKVKDGFHFPLAIIVKSIVILSEDHVTDILPVAWELLLESHQEVVATAASLFIVAAFRAPNKATEIMQKGLQNNETVVRINAVLRLVKIKEFVRNSVISLSQNFIGILTSSHSMKKLFPSTAESA